MISLRDDGPDVQDAPCVPTPEDWAWLCAQARTPDPPAGRAAYLPAAHWFACQVSLHTSLSQEDLDYHRLTAAALDDVLRALRGRRCATAAELVRLPGTIYRGIDLGSVRVPAGPRQSPIADLLDGDAQYYLDLETDLGRLAAWAILQLAEGAEFHGAITVEEYDDAEAALANAAEDVACEFPGNPTW